MLVPVLLAASLASPTKYILSAMIFQVLDIVLGPRNCMVPTALLALPNIVTDPIAMVA